MSIIFQNYVQLTQGAQVKALPPVFTGTTTLGMFDHFAVTISDTQLVLLISAVVTAVLLYLVIHKTPLGRAQRACAQDAKMASLLGISVNRVIALTFMMGAVGAAVAGVMVSLYYGVLDFYMGFLVGIKAFTAAVLGGIGSLGGALLGGILLGLIEVLWSAYFGADYKNVAAFAVLILVLMVRPSGLLGRPTLEKV
jgi:branched-chain amino acid transport system permease protein